MSSNNSLLPSHYQIFLNRLTNWLSIIALVIVIIVALSAWTVRYSINRDCTNPYNRTQKIFGYWITIQAGSDKPECNQPITMSD